MTGPIRDVESAVRELGALPMPTGPALTVDELRAENALLHRTVDSLKELQERDDAEYAEAIRERDALRARVDALQADAELLAALEARGVDSWEGYDAAVSAARQAVAEAVTR